MEAQYNLAHLYESGLGVPKDVGQAIGWYSDAAEQGCTDAQNNLGYLYEHGVGVKRDPSIAVRWYRQAAELGHALAQTNLGILYNYGQGVNHDYLAAAHWYHEAAAQGEPLAQNNLGLMYANGLGVEKDFVESYKRFHLAAQGDDAKVASTAEDNRQRLAENIGPETLAWAQAIAANAVGRQIVELAAIAPAGGVELMRTADFGQPVVTVQRRLDQLDFFKGAIDGLLGPLTTEAVMAYQKAQDMEATGEIDETLLARLLAERE